jgi:hypothetical protein
MAKAGTILKYSAPGFIASHAAHLQEGIIKTLNDVRAAADAFNTELSANRADKLLSPDGRVAGGKKVASAALAKLQAIETTVIKPLADRAATLEKSLLAKVTYTPPTDPAERLSHELRLQEIRSQLRDLPALERLHVYRSTDDPLTLAAIETAPPMLSTKGQAGSLRHLEPFIDPEHLDNARRERAERTDPVTANALSEVQSLRQAYTLAVNSVKKEILDEQPGALAPDPAIYTT